MSENTGYRTLTRAKASQRYTSLHLGICGSIERVKVEFSLSVPRVSPVTRSPIGRRPRSTSALEIRRSARSEM